VSIVNQEEIFTPLTLQIFINVAKLDVIIPLHGCKESLNLIDV
jgi:hypothetical protein